MSLRDDTYNAIPGYTAAAATIEHAAKYKGVRTEPTLPAALTAAITRVQNLIAEGAPIPTSIGDTLESAERADRAAELQALAIRDALRTGQHDLGEIIEDGVDDAFEFLDTRLQQLVTEVRELSLVLDGITNATDALTAGPDTAAAWASLAALTGDYDDIRRVQLELYKKVTTATYGDHERFSTAGVYRDFADVCEYFTARRAQAVTDYQAARGSATDTTSNDPSTVGYNVWLADINPHPIPTGDGYHWFDDGDRATFLLRFAAVNPWIPSLDTISRAFDAAVTATSTATRVIPPQIEARTVLYRLTGLHTRHDVVAPAARQIEGTDTARDITHTAKQKTFDEQLRLAREKRDFDLSYRMTRSNISSEDPLLMR